MALLAACLAAPVADLLDRWDGGNDVEGGLVVVVLCVGFGLLARVAAGAVPLMRGAARPTAIFNLSPSRLAAVVHHASVACIDGPPVLPLRI